MERLFILGLMVHLICDFFLQNNWMAQNKSDTSSIAGPVHAGIHFVGLMFVFPPYAAMWIAIIHYGIDLRTPLAWWRKFYGQTKDPTDPVFIPFAMWQDQAIHIIVLGIMALVSARFP